MALIHFCLENKIFSTFNSSYYYYYYFFAQLTIPINNKLLLGFNTNEDPNNKVNQKVIINLMQL